MRQPFSWPIYLAVTFPIVLTLNVLTHAYATGSVTQSSWDILATVVTFSLAASAVFISMRAFPRGAERLSWLIIGIGILLFGIGDLIWIVGRYQFDQMLFPSLGHWCYFSFYVLVWIGLFLQPHFHQPTRFGREVLLIDMTIVLFSALSLVWVSLVSPALRNNPALPLTDQALIAAYPTLDILTLLCIAVLQYRNRGNAFGLPRAILAAGVLTLLTADIIYAVKSISGTLEISRLLDILWATAFLLFGAAALAHARRYARAADVEANGVELPSRERQLLVFLLVTTAGIAVLVLFLTPGDRSVAEKGLLIVTMLIIFLVMIRQWLIFEENRRLYGELRNAYQDVSLLAQTDPITGLYNYRYFMERLEEEVERAKRYGNPIALIFADLDYFKQVNDTHGHHIGDVALRQVAIILQQHIRTADILARYAGEEFVVLLPETTLEQAIVLAERLRHSLETIGISLDNGQHITITGSFGLSAFPTPSNSMEALLADADSAMYHVKRMDATISSSSARAAISPSPSPRSQADRRRGIADSPADHANRPLLDAGNAAPRAEC